MKWTHLLEIKTRHLSTMFNLVSVSILMFQQFKDQKKYDVFFREKCALRKGIVCDIKINQTLQMRKKIWYEKS